jgi:hypothetical protein
LHFVNPVDDGRSGGSPVTQGIGSAHPSILLAAPRGTR